MDGAGAFLVLRDPLLRAERHRTSTETAGDEKPKAAGQFVSRASQRRPDDGPTFLGSTSTAPVS